MRHKNFILGIIAITIISTASGTTIGQEKITIDLEENTITSDIRVERLTTQNFNYQTTHPVKNLKVWFNGERKQCSIEELAFGTKIGCETKLNKNFSVKLKYDTSKLISEQNKVQKFSYSQSIYRPIDSYILKVILPEGTGLVDESNITAPVIQPKGAELGNMNGRRFYVRWNTRPDLGTAQFQVIFEELDKNTTQSILPVFLALSLIIGIAAIVYHRKNQVDASNTLDELDSDEKMVIDILRENKGEILQKDIVDRSEYSKAKISGVVGSLEEKNIVSKEKEGRSNKVFLNKKFRT